MSVMAEPSMHGVSETSFITPYLRATESRRPDALIKDEKSEAMVKKISDDGLYDFGRIESLHLSNANKLVIIPDSVVVHIGCSLDTRFERVDNGKVEWYDLDLPDVIELRLKLDGGEGKRYHFLGRSILENAWLDTASSHGQRPFLFLAEGVFTYLEGAQVRSPVQTLRDRFPGAELVFDAYSPIHVWRHNLQTSASKIDFPTRWGIWHGEELES